MVVQHVALLGSAAAAYAAPPSLAASLGDLQLDQEVEADADMAGSGSQKGGRGVLKDSGERVPEGERCPCFDSPVPLCALRVLRWST